MKAIKRMMLTLFMVLSAVCVQAQEVILECSYNTNQDYKCLIVATAEGGECVVKGGGVTCHYDIEWKLMGENVVINATNPSQSGWIDVLYIIGGEGNHIIFVPKFPDGSNCFPLTYKKIDPQNHEQKKREYGLVQASGKDNGK